MRYFIYISYLGTNYHGWQVQENALSIQQILNNSLSKILKEDIKTVGAGRTDTGVHALNQVCLLYTSPSPRDERGYRCEGTT